MNLETLLPLYADWFIFELLEFLIEDGGCCCIMVLGIVSIILVIVGKNRKQAISKQQNCGATDLLCDKCNTISPKSARFCATCGAAFAADKTSGSFYDTLRIRVSNWRKWGW